MAVKIGIVGKPSVGKSTFFKAATLMNVDIANYPFTTIEANTGFAHIKIPCVDKELQTQCNPRTGWCTNNKRYVPFELIDVAGLVPGAHKGRGRGLAFLNDLNEADALIHIIDTSGSVNEEGEEVSPGSHDPLTDVQFLEEELNQWYLTVLQKDWQRLARRIQQEKMKPETVLLEKLSGLRVTESHIKEALKEQPENLMQWDENNLLSFCTFIRKKSKPILLAANKIDKNTSKENLKRIQEAHPETIIVPCSAELELALREADKAKLINYQPGEENFEILKKEALNDKQTAALNYAKAFLDEHNNTGVQEVMNKAVFNLLEYKAIYPGGTKKLEDKEGNRLPDCFLLPKTTTALDFARHLHTDFAKHFIRAIDVKKKIPVAKDHVLEHRDVIEIISAK
ncbi:MAG: redox-regulated ATPase YchF [Candidatus Woesearchaeota archaeon]